MNAALLLMTSAMGAGGDVIPAGWGEPSPAAVRAGGCCGAPAASCCDSCGCGRTKLLDRLRAKHARKSSSCCDSCAPAPCHAPVPAPAPAACAPAPCGSNACCSDYYRPNLLDKLRCHRAAKKSSCCEPACPCGPAAAPGTPAAPPKEMPAPTPMGKGMSSIDVLPRAVIPAPLAPVPSVPVTGQPVRSSTPY
ncbi:MAG TPA: hypothetical protein VLM40_08120 [Gemmata sp.]|nr:hypothetical protein [Gemmata sp.]